MGGDFGEGDLRAGAFAERGGAWILYDGTCPMCRRGAERFRAVLRRRGFKLETLQTAAESGFAAGERDEMKVVTGEGRVIGGAEGFAYICGAIWWARPVAWVWRIVRLRPVMRAIYRWVAAHRHCDGSACGIGTVNR